MRCFSTWASICILHVRARRSMLNRRTVQVPAPSCCSLRLVKWTHALAAALVRRQEAGRGRAQGPASRFEPATWLTRRPVLPAQIPLAEEAQASLRARAPLPPSVHLIGRRPGGGDRPAGAPRGGVPGLLTRAVPRKEGVLASRESGAASHKRNGLRKLGEMRLAASQRTARDGDCVQSAAAACSAKCWPS